MITFEISKSAQDLLRKLEQLAQTVGPAIAAAIDTENQLTIGYIIERKLSVRGPLTLGVVTNRLRGSARAAKAEVSGNVITSSLGSNVKYAGVHEFGYTGTVTVPGFTRRNKSGDRFHLLAIDKKDRDAGGVRDFNISRAMAEKLGAFTSRGNARAFLRKTTSGVSFVRSHRRKLNFTARHMFESGIEERGQNYSDAISEAVIAEVAS